MPVKQQQTKKKDRERASGLPGRVPRLCAADVFPMLFATSGLENSPAAFSTISGLMRLPGCERDSIAARLITNDVADLLCQFAFITFNQTYHACGNTFCHHLKKKTPVSKQSKTLRPEALPSWCLQITVPKITFLLNEIHMTTF